MKAAGHLEGSEKPRRATGKVETLGNSRISKDFPLCFSEENVQSFRISKDFPLLKVSGFPRMVPLLKRLGGGEVTHGRTGLWIGVWLAMVRLPTDGRDDPPPPFQQPGIPAIQCDSHTSHPPALQQILNGLL